MPISQESILKILIIAESLIQAHDDIIDHFKILLRAKRDGTVSDEQIFDSLNEYVLNGYNRILEQRMKVGHERWVYDHTHKRNEKARERMKQSRARLKLGEGIRTYAPRTRQDNGPDIEYDEATALQIKYAKGEAIEPPMDYSGMFKKAKQND